MFKENLEKGFVGQIVNTEPKVVVSRTAEAVVPFGSAVVRGADDGSCRVIAAGDTAVFGVATRQHGTVVNDDGSREAYKARASVGIMLKGVVYVTAGVDVTQGQPVFVVAADGSFTNVDTNVAIANAQFDESVAAGELVAIRLG